MGTYTHMDAALQLRPKPPPGERSAVRQRTSSAPGPGQSDADRIMNAEREKLMSGKSQTAETIESRLRVATWNVWWRFGPWEQREPAILQSLSEMDADVIALQEVWGDDATNFAHKAGDHLGYHHSFAASMEIEGYEFGNAILSRWPIIRDDYTMLFGREESGEGRLALFADIEGPRGRIPAFSTHLNWKYEHSHIRQRQVADLSRFVDQKRPWSFPPVVCGDFNSEPGSDEIRMLTGLTTCPAEGLVFHDAWAVAGGDGSGLTWDNTNPHVVVEFEPDRRLDYIFVGRPGPGGAGHVVDCQLAGNVPVGEIWPSDHFAVVAELRY